jgi:phage baseplate assembly protein V
MDYWEAILRLSQRLEAAEKQVIELHRQCEEANRRIHNMLRPGRVTQISQDGSEVKVAYALDDDGNDVETGWIPWTSRAGAVKIWSPPSIGEQVRIHSPSGDVSDHSWVDPGGFSNANPANHNKAGEYKKTVGQSSSTYTGNSISHATTTHNIQASTINHQAGTVNIKGTVNLG